MRVIAQQRATDCGVACLAMLVGCTYEAAAAAFTALALDRQRTRRSPWSSNFKELREAAAFLGVKLSMTRFRGWEAIDTVAIVKTLVEPSGNWHWVLAGWDDGQAAMWDPNFAAPFRWPATPTINTIGPLYPSGSMLVRSPAAAGIAPAASAPAAPSSGAAREEQQIAPSLPTTRCIGLDA